MGRQTFLRENIDRIISSFQMDLKGWRSRGNWNAGDDFVKDQPELLEKIGKRYEERLYEARGKRSESLWNRMKNCKTQKEIDLVLKEDLNDIEVGMRASMDEHLSEQVQAFVRVVEMERECRRGEAFPKHVEDRVQLVLDSLNDFTTATRLL